MNYDSKERIWAAIRSTVTDIAFTALDIEDIVHEEGKPRINPQNIRRYLQGLTKAGYTKRSESGALITATWRLIKDTGIEAPNVNQQGNLVQYGRKYEQIWRTIRILKTFDTRELAINASTEECTVSQLTVSKYCSFLKNAGYLLARGKNGNRDVLFLINSMNTGPKPPSIERNAQVRDGNTGQVMWSSGAEVGDE